MKKFIFTNKNEAKIYINKRVKSIKQELLKHLESLNTNESIDATYYIEMEYK
ncbi:MAG: hypothetical protein M0R03_13080 [Novosphingobium sp.]|nr:hypothetical protein [Novosphingobium sp.]